MGISPVFGRSHAARLAGRGQGHWRGLHYKERCVGLVVLLVGPRVGSSVPPVVVEARGVAELAGLPGGAACKLLRLFRGLPGCGEEVEVFPTETVKFLSFLSLGTFLFGLLHFLGFFVLGLLRGLHVVGFGDLDFADQALCLRILVPHVVGVLVVADGDHERSATGYIRSSV